MRQPLSYPARHRQHPALTVPQDTGPLRLDVGSRTNSPRILAALIGEVRLRSSPPGGGLARGTDREDGFVMRLDFPVLTVTTFAIMRIALLFLLLSAVPAVAGWDVGSFQDRMTDRKETYATITTAEGASLYVGCLNGQVFPRITFPARVAYGTIGATYRFDSRGVEMRIAPVSSDGRDVWLWIGAPAAAVTDLRKSKRLRVQIGTTFLDFDLSGSETALSGIKCR
jgi:hypothetical protein